MLVIHRTLIHDKILTHYDLSHLSINNTDKLTSFYDTHTYIYMYVCMYVYIYMYVCMYIYTLYRSMEY